MAENADKQFFIFQMYYHVRKTGLGLVVQTSDGMNYSQIKPLTLLYQNQYNSKWLVSSDTNYSIFIIHEQNWNLH